MLTPPVLLTKYELIEPIVQALEKLHSIEKVSPEGKSGSLQREGLFVLAVSTVEVMISDTLLVLLRHFPGKLPDKQFTVPKTVLLHRPFDILEEQVQAFLQSLSYKSLAELLDFTHGHLADIRKFRQEEGDTLQEIKESRNLLLHNNLVPNPMYQNKAGPSKRKTLGGSSRLEIDTNYFHKSLGTLKRLCEDLQSGILVKFSDYTRVDAVRKLWEYVFPRPDMKFEEYWIIDEKKDEVIAQKIDEYPRLSHSEQMFLGIWLSHFNRRGDHPDAELLNMYHLDFSHQEKMMWLLSMLREFRVY